jgi:hypothetical protein
MSKLLRILGVFIFEDGGSRFFLNIDEHATVI